jgi:hypothetical protein
MMPLWDFVREHRASVTWIVAIWMVTVLVLLIVGPVWHP